MSRTPCGIVANADLEFRGTYDRPVLVGRGEVERGEFNFEGKRYVITRGTIDFNNPTRIEPFFDIQTETQVRVPSQTYRVMVRVTGTMARFTPTFSSDPPLTEVQVLSLLFSDVAPGQDVEFSQYSTVTPQEQLLRERAARALTGALTTELGRVAEQTFGVDTFQLTPSLVTPNANSSRLDRAARSRLASALRPRVPDLLAQPLVDDERSDHLARVPIRPTASRGFCRATRIVLTRSTSGSGIVFERRGRARGKMRLAHALLTTLCPHLAFRILNSARRRADASRPVVSIDVQQEGEVVTDPVISGLSSHGPASRCRSRMSANRSRISSA